LSSGFEGFNDTYRAPVNLPVRQLAQGLTKIEGIEDIRPGFFYDSTGKRELGKTMEVVVLKVDTQRVLFYAMGAAPAGHKGPRCFSDDGLVPSPRVKNKVSAVCADCEFAQKDMVYRLFCLDVDETIEKGEPVLFTIDAKSTQLKTVRSFVQAVRSKGKNARDFAVTLKSQTQKNEKGSWYVMQFEQITPVSAELKGDVEAAYRATSGDLPDDGPDDNGETPF
jgi:hypothetical protein